MNWEAAIAAVQAAQPKVDPAIGTGAMLRTAADKLYDNEVNGVGRGLRVES